MYIFLVFPYPSSWHMTCWPYSTASGSKLAQKIANFQKFDLFLKISQYVLQKSEPKKTFSKNINDTAYLIFLYRWHWYLKKFLQPLFSWRYLAQKFCQKLCVIICSSIKTICSRMKTICISMGILLHMVHAIHYNHTNHLHKYRKSHTHGLFTKIGQIQTICNRMYRPIEKEKASLGVPVNIFYHLLYVMAGHLNQ